jgi:plasmid replication initiation protein
MDAKHHPRLPHTRHPFLQALPSAAVPGAALDPLIHPVFGLAKSPRATPIQIRLGGFAIAVEAPLGRTIATIWDADILIWAACHMTELRARGEPVPRSLAATPEHILAFIGRHTTVRHCHRLKAALDRLQSTTVSMALHDKAGRRIDRFSWLSEWTEHADAHGRITGIALVVPEWLRRAILDGAIALTADRGYFGLRDGLERWLYRLAADQLGRTQTQAPFDLRDLHAGSASQSPLSRFAGEVEDIVQRQSLPGVRLHMQRRRGGARALVFDAATEPSTANEPGANHAECAEGHR